MSATRARTFGKFSVVDRKPIVPLSSPTRTSTDVPRRSSASDSSSPVSESVPSLIMAAVMSARPVLSAGSYWSAPPTKSILK